jgi:hypothetical protein
MTAKKEILEFGMETAKEPVSLTIWIFRIHSIITGTVIGQDWILHGPNFFWYFFLISVLFVTVLVGTIIRFRKKLPKYNTVKSRACKLFIALIVLLSTWAVVGSLNLILYEGLSKMPGIGLSSDYNIKMNTAIIYFEIIVPAVCYTALLLMERKLEKLSNSCKAFPFLAWL